MKVLADTLSGTEVFASVASLCELIRKKDKKDAMLSDPLPWWDKYVVRAGIPTLAIRQSHIMEIALLPEFHTDPFHRILIAQAKVEKATLVSKDTVFSSYSIPVVW